MKEIVLVDGYSLIFRAYYAMPSLVSPGGIPTGAVFGFANMLVHLLNRHRDATIAVAYDRKDKTFRHKMFEAYKGTRKETDEDLIVQFPIVREMLEALGIPVIEKSGYEADDLIGTLAKAATDRGMRAFVYTGDKDALQLIQYGIYVNITLKGVSNIESYDEAKVFEKLGVTSAQVVDFKSLRGDVSDNIPGAKGIGDKTAARLLSEYGTTENILAGVDSIKPERISKIVRENAEMIRLSKVLATIVLDAPVDLDEVRESDADYDRVRALFTELGFTSLLKKIAPAVEDSRVGAASAVASRFGAASGVASRSTVSVSRSPSGELSSAKRSSSSDRVVLSGKNAPYVSYAPFLSQEDAAAVAASDIGSAETSFVHSLKTVSVSEFDFSLPFTFGVELINDGAWGAFRSAYCFRDGVLTVIREEHDFLALKGQLEDSRIKKTVFSSKELYLYCFSKGIRLDGIEADVVIAAYLSNPARKTYRLEDLAAEMGYAVRESEAGRQLSMLEAESAPEAKPTQEEEAAERAVTVKRLADRLDAALLRANLGELYQEIELPLVRVLADMEFTGFKIGRDVLLEIGERIDGGIAQSEAKIHALAGESFNIASPKQLGAVLFERLGLPPLKKNKTGYSTDKDVLEKLGEEYEIARLVIEYRSLTKLKSNYIDSLLALERNGRIHTSLNQTIAVTGRLSSTEPNLQNIPIRMEEGRNIRKAFKSEDGSVLLDADYSQIELRVLAHMSADETLIEAFESGADIHTLTASEVFGVQKEEVTPLQRSHAKEVNFGIIYGMGDFGLSESLKIPLFEAKHYIERYFSTYRSVQPFMERIVADCREKGYVQTLFGRKRQIPELQVKNKNVQAHGVRMARNTVIQGTAADIIKIAMIRLYRTLAEKKLRSKLILQIHDELILNVPLKELDEVKQILRESMEGAVQLRVPLKVEMQVAETWYDAK